MDMKRLTIPLLLFGGLLSLQAKEISTICSFNNPIQQLSDEGNFPVKVIDENGYGMADVEVVVKELNQTFYTDINGDLNIETTLENLTLTVSFDGYSGLEQQFATNSPIQISLHPEQTNSLDEVVVIGYGTAKKKDLTGSVSDVKGEEVAKRNSTNVSQALQGSMPGLMVTRNSGSPNASATIVVRGITSIGDTSPLVIMDGVPVKSIDDVNANDIEDVTVLKDAASASIYGARAASGVILITTKREAKGKTNIEYQNAMTWITPTTFPTTVGAKRYMEMMNEFAWNDTGNASGSEHSIYAQETIYNYDQLHQDDPNRYPLTDWKKLLLKNSAFKESHAISLTSGNDKSTTRASISYDNMGEIYANQHYKRLMARVNNTYKVSNKLAADFDMSYVYSKEESPNINPIWEAIRFAPIYAAFWEDGRISDGKTGSNAYAKLHYGGTDNTWKNVLNGRVAMHYTPVKGLKLSAIVAPNVSFNKRKKFVKQIPYYSPEDPNVFMGYMSGFATTNLAEYRTDEVALTKQFLANYQNDFGKHSVNALVGYEDFYTKNELVKATGDYFELMDFPYLDLAPTDYQKANGSAYETSYRSYFGRVMYDYANKYFLQANIRYDGSSRFHPDHRWGAFPSISAGWAVSEESFLKDVDFLSYLKVRASWGQLGNERIGYYPYQSSINFSNALFYMGGQVVSGTTAAQVNYAIQDITWEVTETKNIGLDAQFFKNRLNVTFDYYKKETSDMLLELEIPDYIGYDNPQQNTGSMYTKGWDFSISWRDRINDFKYGIALNLSDSKSVMGDLGGIVFDDAQAIMAGGQYKEWYGYIAEGIYQTQDEVANSATLNKNVKPGDIRYKDISGPDGMADGIISPEYDRQLLGGSLPRYLFGGTLDVAYKGFDFAMTFQGVGKQNAYLSTQFMKPFQSSWTNPSGIIDGNYWSVYNTAEENMKAKYPRLSNVGAENNNYETSTFWMRKGSYFRMKNITIGYTLPAYLTDKVGISSLRVFASGNDLFSIDSFPKGWDPEVNYNTYISRSFTLGLSVKF